MSEAPRCYAQGPFDAAVIMYLWCELPKGHAGPHQCGGRRYVDHLAFLQEDQR